MCDKDQTQIQRVIYMEEIHDRLRAVLHGGGAAAGQLAAMQKDIGELRAYYEGDDWLKDYDAEQRDVFDRKLKRGILAEDTLYDLFDEIDTAMALTGGE